MVKIHINLDWTFLLLHSRLKFEYKIFIIIHAEKHDLWITSLFLSEITFYCHDFTIFKWWVTPRCYYNKNMNKTSTVEATKCDHFGSDQKWLATAMVTTLIRVDLCQVINHSIEINTFPSLQKVFFSDQNDFAIFVWGKKTWRTTIVWLISPYRSRTILKSKLRLWPVSR